MSNPWIRPTDFSGQLIAIDTHTHINSGSPYDTPTGIGYSADLADLLLLSRGAGIGKRMLQMAIRYAADFLKAKRITIGVLENNPGALRCYLGAGFREVPQAEPVYYELLGQRIRCIELEMDV
jgi:GNAT superfamily N-acetyltransferase